MYVGTCHNFKRLLDRFRRLDKYLTNLKRKFFFGFQPAPKSSHTIPRRHPKDTYASSVKLHPTLLVKKYKRPIGHIAHLNAIYFNFILIRCMNTYFRVISNSMVYQLIILFHMTIFVHKVLYYDINLKFLLINIFNFILPNNTLYFHW